VSPNWRSDSLTNNLHRFEDCLVLTKTNKYIGITMPSHKKASNSQKSNIEVDFVPFWDKNHPILGKMGGKEMIYTP